MKALGFLPALLATLLISTSASAQGSPGTGSSNAYQTGEPGVPDTANEWDVRHNQCNSGDKDACFAIEFGQCADRNPRVAVPACTRQLMQQENRRFGGDVRYERAIRYVLRAIAYTNQGDMGLALEDYDQAVTADDSVFWIHAQRGDANFLAGNFDQALNSYNAALALSPDIAAVLCNRALAYAAAPDEGLRNPQQALADAQRANEVAPGQPTYIDALAVAYAANGDFERAIAESQRAIDLLPADNQALLDDYGARLSLYQNNQPFRIVSGAGS